MKKLSLNILSSINNMITIGERTFSPIRELIREELTMRNHSESYIKNALENDIRERHSENGFYGDTKNTALRIYMSHQYKEEIFLSFDLRNIQRAPYWMVERLKEWGFDLEKLNASKCNMKMAGTLLYEDDDMTIPKQVEAIIAHINHNDLIDEVKGVHVWEKVERSLTCREFLETITE